MEEIMANHTADWGVWSVLLSLFIEGSAFPFVGTFFIVTMGFILELTWLEIGVISLVGSLLYTVGSYIPYFISLTLGVKLEAKLNPEKRKKLKEAQEKFSSYGIWSVAIASPLHLGNVIPFMAGMAKMNLKVYSLLTMLGIAPSTFLFLSIGKFYEGDREVIMGLAEEYQLLVLTGFVLVTALYILFKRKREKGIGG
ncbi:DedA family protein [Rossellomorea aquimaris]|uniref:Membrane protein DedA with SNARE-associated domain n=1 Tax=Rossellomorea aquimaris TaxID=189382 RepID=A0A366EU72_9BACI|nr:VTT domain-containing protein [Rossellomorea aquimaris]RBP05953.1 membrane protein DedA with SNARE-associated domain [Rossellomorea aquimaris]